MSLITKNEYQSQFGYCVTNLIAKFGIKPVEKVGRLGYYDVDQIHDIRKQHIKGYIAELKEKGFQGEAFESSEIELVEKRRDLNYKQKFVRDKAAATGVLDVTVVFRMNKGLKELHILPVGFTYNSKLIYSHDDLEMAYSYACRMVKISKKKK